jgi:hypothetical protein
MDMSINKKGPINQLESFEKPCFVIMKRTKDKFKFKVCNYNVNIVASSFQT